MTEIEGIKHPAQILKVLLCEDNEVNIKVIQAVLKRFKITLNFAKNGQEALDQFINDKPDLILMDCSMPVMDGLQATRLIRELEKENNIEKAVLIFALTANASSKDREECLASGMDDAIFKPIRRETIEQLFKKWELPF